MRAVDIIQKKRDGLALNKEEIEWLIEGYVAGTVPDYQMSSFAMAVYFKGMTTEEISHMTMKMVQTGQQFDLSAIPGIKVDISLCYLKFLFQQRDLGLGAFGCKFWCAGC